MTTPVLIDVDTGYDDALALLAALCSPQLEVRAITCVAGNQRLPQVVDNTLRLLSYLGRETPVAAGMDRPLLEPLHDRRWPCMEPMAWPSLLCRPAAVRSSRTMPSTCCDRTLTTAPAPLTLDLPCAADQHRDPAAHVSSGAGARSARSMVMGGTLAVHGNTSPLAEFNMRADPEAAAIVLESGLPVRLYPLDVFRKVQFGQVRDGGSSGRRSSAAAELPGASWPSSATFFNVISPWSAMRARSPPRSIRAGCEVEQYPLTWRLTGVARGMTVLDRRTPGQRSAVTDWWQTSRLRSRSSLHWTRHAIGATP